MFALIRENAVLVQGYAIDKRNRVDYLILLLILE